MEKIIDANKTETGVRVVFLSGLQPVAEYFSIETLKWMDIHPLDLLEHPGRYGIHTSERRLVSLQVSPDE